jgi:hypothetical protein
MPKYTWVSRDLIAVDRATVEWPDRLIWGSGGEQLVLRGEL